MVWIKKTQIFTASHQSDLMASHAQIPVPMPLDETSARIYFSSRDITGKTRPFSLDYDFSADKIIEVQTAPLLELGAAGTFDDSGIMPACAVRVGAEIYMYYIAWNVRVSVPYHLSIGLAISSDGKNFRKHSDGPVMDRGSDEPFFNTAPCVIYDGNQFRMWYISCTGWKDVNGRKEPVYLVRHATSDDGIKWARSVGPVIAYAYDGEAIGRPWVVQENGVFRMWYSTRGSIDYRLPGGQHYKIGYAESKDGLVWQRLDDQAGITLSTTGWDSEMMEYCSILSLPDKKIMLYNGNMFGLTGFGYAEENLR